MTSRDTERTFLRGRLLQRNVSQQETGTHFDHTYSKGFSKKLATLLAICLLATRTGANNVNEPPILEPGGYPAGLPLSESTKVGTEVFVLKGHDPEGSPVKYGIQLTDHFVVNPRTGVITLAKPLNREILSQRNQTLR